MKFTKSSLKRYPLRVFYVAKGLLHSKPKRIKYLGTDLLFAKFVEEHMDRKAYLEAYPDVKAAGADPVGHWLEYGMFEGRFLAPNMRVVFGKNVNSIVSYRSWQRFTWKGQPVAVQTVTLRQSLVDQILDQSRHEPAVLAAGALAIGNLRQIDALDLLGRDGVDDEKIFSEIDTRPNVVLMMPFLSAGGADKYAADLVSAFSSLDLGPILVLITDNSADTNHGWESLSILAPLKTVSVVFWRDICGPAYTDPIALARLLNALRPSFIVVNNSRIGFDMVARYGKSLSSFSKIYCTYFSLGFKGLEAPYGTRYPRKTLPYSVALTDNEKMAAQLRRLWGPIEKYGIKVLPPRIQSAETSVFYARLGARQRRAANTSRSLRWVWISRIEPLKGTAILGTLADMLPTHHFDLYGPVRRDLAELNLIKPNIKYCGELTNVSAADLTGYDGFIFTSLTEGMPNIVLEMSQHAIPMVISDVGGLRDTFNDSAALFVPLALDDTKQSALRFKQALESAAKLSPSGVRTMAEEARAQVIKRHSPEAYLKSFTEMIEGASDNG